MLERWLRRLHKAEDGLLAALLGGLLLLALAQIVLRLFGHGLDWAEAISRTGVVWLALLAALGATRNHKHIAIDVLPRLLPPGPQRLAWILTQLAAAAITAALAWFGWGMVQLEMEAPLPFVAGLPSWAPMLAVPLGFGLMSLRFVLAACRRPHFGEHLTEGLGAEATPVDPGTPEAPR